MGERRVLSEQDLVDLAKGLKSLEWSWDPDEVGRIAEEFGWKVESRRSLSVRLNSGFGTGYADLTEGGKVEQISVPVCVPESAETAEGRTYLQDAFARAVAAFTRGLGEPTERIPGESAEVRWRVDGATIGVKRLSVQVNVYIATNDYIEYIDRAREQGL